MARILQTGLTQREYLLQREVIMLDKIKSIDWIYTVLLLLGIRALVEASFPQALIVICFAGLKAYKDFLASKEVPDLNAEVKKQLDEVKTTVAGLAMKSAVKPAQMEQEIRRFF